MKHLKLVIILSLSLLVAIDLFAQPNLIIRPRFSGTPLNGDALADTTYVQNLITNAVTGLSNDAVNINLDNTDLDVVVETELQAFADGVDHSLYKARGTGVNTTYVSTVSVGGTTFAQPEFFGEIKSDEGYFDIHYTGATGVTVANLNASSTYVYIDNAGALQQQTSIPTRQDWSRKIFTMRIAVNTSTNQIIAFEYLNNPLGNYTNTSRDLYEYLISQGIPFKKDMLITGRTDNLGFDVSSGSLLEFGGTGDINNPNINSFDAVSNSSYNLMSRTSLVSSQTNLVKSWDNAGTITALGSTTLVGHRLYRFSSGNFALQYGQGNYANMDLARAGILTEDYVLNPVLKDATFMGWWLIEDIATNTGNTGATTTTAFVEYTIGIQGGVSSGLSGALLKGNNLSDLTDVAQARVELGLTATNDTTHIGNSDLTLTGDRTLTMSGNDLNFSGGNVGIGETNPTQGLLVVGDDGIEMDMEGTTPVLRLNPNNTYFQSVFQYGNGAGQFISTLFSSNGYYWDTPLNINIRNGADANKTAHILGNNGSRYFYNSSGVQKSIWDSVNEGFGIGASTPSAALDVVGNVQFDDYGLESIGGSTAGVVLVADDDGNLMDNSGIYTDGGGNVGIGETNPTQGLLVVGDDGIEMDMEGTTPTLRLNPNNTYFQSSFQYGNGAGQFIATLFSSNGYYWDTPLNINIRNGADANKTAHILGNNGSRTFYNSSGVQKSIWDSVNERFGIGTSTPSAKLDVVGTTELNGDLTIGTGSTILFDDNNVMIGASAGNATMTGANNNLIGIQAGLGLTSGYNNNFFGNQAGKVNTTGISNNFFGIQAGFDNSIGSNNNFFGAQSGFNNTSGQANNFFGEGSGENNTTGSDNIAIGEDAGKYVGTAKSSAATVINNSILLGYRTSPNASGETNQIVIGHDAVGNGSNTTVIGNSSTISTELKGETEIDNGDIYINTIAKGIILKSPDGTCYRVTVANGGAFASASITCP